MTRSESIGALAAALAKAQGAMHGAAKESRNPHFNSRYADLASIVDACRNELAKNEISYAQFPSTPEAGLVRMTTLLLHSSGEWLESEPLTVQAKDAGPQAVGSCLTYLRRYQLAAMVGIAPEDDDAEAAEGRLVSQVARPVPQAPPPPFPNANRMPTAPTKAAPSGRPTNKPTAPPLAESDIPF